MGVSSAIALARHRHRRVHLPDEPRARRRDGARASPAVHRLLLNKYYVDELYDAAIVQPIKRALGRRAVAVRRRRVIDGAVNGVGVFVRGSAARAARLQTGSVRAYAASLFLGVVLILGYYLMQ